MLSCRMRSLLFCNWMMNPYMRHGKYLKSYYENALPMGFRVASRWMVVDASMNVALLSKSYNEAYEIIKRRPTNREVSGRRVAGVHEVDALTSLATQNFPSNLDCVYYVGNQNQNRSGQGPQSNFYNSSWRNHPNFSWSNQGARPNNTYMQHRSNQPLGFNQQVQKPSQAEPSNNLEILLKAYMTKNDVLIQSQPTTLENLENQMGKEHCKVVALRSRKTLEPKVVEVEDEHAKRKENQL
ncbi:nifU-like protein 2, chloroplastic [Gossypium australe]|uniref:NifU-like protein 2, chloroplastic n=1 Tax=Gossypium australe TaxID=47621 RepID=A0A5B6UUL8_9ROSI|nr:nifU-like protein 2, chloroplastic [Gossypium australe]